VCVYNNLIIQGETPIEARVPVPRQSTKILAKLYLSAFSNQS